MILFYSENRDPGLIFGKPRPQVARSKAEVEIAEAERKRDTNTKTAEATREGQKVKLTADAEVALAERDKRIRTTGEAEAEAIKAKGIAEAETKEWLADAMAKYGKAAVVELLVAQLPQIMLNVAKPMENIEEITVIDTGDGKGGASKRMSNGF